MSQKLENGWEAAFQADPHHHKEKQGGNEKTFLTNEQNLCQKNLTNKKAINLSLMVTNWFYNSKYRFIAKTYS